jgi:ABC-type sugar transport system ATPase subunit
VRDLTRVGWGGAGHDAEQSAWLEIMRLTMALGLTVVYVTHDQDEAFTMSDRIALLQGQDRTVRHPETMYERPIPRRRAVPW